jgi:hypothetical protein
MTRIGMRRNRFDAQTLSVAQGPGDLMRHIQATLIGLLAILAAVSNAWAESVPFACETPDPHTIRITISNPANRERSCIVSCQFQTPHYGGEVQIICAHPVKAATKDTEMCVKDSGGQELLKQTFGSADCTNF